MTDTLLQQFRELEAEQLLRRLKRQQPSRCEHLASIIEQGRETCLNPNCREVLQ